jgi:hypothetical protein
MLSTILIYFLLQSRYFPAQNLLASSPDALLENGVQGRARGGKQAGGIYCESNARGGSTIDTCTYIGNSSAVKGEWKIPGSEEGKEPREARIPTRSGGEVVFLEQAYPRPRFFVPVTFAISTVLLSCVFSLVISAGSH